MVRRPQRRLAVGALMREGLSQRKACFLACISVNGFRYRCKESGLNQELRRKMAEIVGTYRRWGLPTIHLYLRKLGYRVNRKRLHRLYREDSLQIRKRRRRQKRVHERVAMTPAQRPNQRWSMDFIHDNTAADRKIKCLVVVDDYTRECLAIEVDHSIPGQYVCQILEQLVLIHGRPEAILTDNGPEFLSKAYTLWALENNIRIEYIEPGKPSQNAFAESFNSLLREQCLNENWFMSLEDSRRIIENWRKVYNQIRPHGSLGGKTPEEYGNEQRAKTLIPIEEEIGV